MKKSQLRNIIRESIKELMTEQAYPPCYTCLNGLIYASTGFFNSSNNYLCGGASANNYPTFFTGTVDPNTSTIFPPGPLGGYLAYFSDVNDPMITSIGCSPQPIQPIGPPQAPNTKNNNPNITGFNPRGFKGDDLEMSRMQKLANIE